MKVFSKSFFVLLSVIVLFLVGCGDNEVKANARALEERREAVQQEQAALEEIAEAKRRPGYVAKEIKDLSDGAQVHTKVAD